MLVLVTFSWLDEGGVGMSLGILVLGISKHYLGSLPSGQEPGPCWNVSQCQMAMVLRPPGWAMGWDLTDKVTCARGVYCLGVLCMGVS